MSVWSFVVMKPMVHPPLRWLSGDLVGPGGGSRAPGPRPCHPPAAVLSACGRAMCLLALRSASRMANAFTGSRGRGHDWPNRASAQERLPHRNDYRTGTTTARERLPHGNDYRTGTTTARERLLGDELCLACVVGLLLSAPTVERQGDDGAD